MILYILNSFRSLLPTVRLSSKIKHITQALRVNHGGLVKLYKELNLKQKGMREVCSTFAYAKCVNCLRQFRSAFRTNRGISPTAAHSLTRSASTTKGCCEVDLGLCPYLAPPSSKQHDLPQKVDQNFYVFCQHKTIVSKLKADNHAVVCLFIN